MDIPQPENLGVSTKGQEGESSAPYNFHPQIFFTVVTVILIGITVGSTLLIVNNLADRARKDAEKQQLAAEVEDSTFGSFSVSETAEKYYAVEEHVMTLAVTGSEPLELRNYLDSELAKTNGNTSLEVLLNSLKANYLAEWGETDAALALLDSLEGKIEHSYEKYYYYYAYSYVYRLTGDSEKSAEYAALAAKENYLEEYLKAQGGDDE